MSDVAGGPLSVALVGPYTSGKTTLLESMLFVSGAIGRRGSVREGNSVGDASPEARARQSGVEVNTATFDHGGTQLTVLDCPGSVEFSQETFNALMGVDLAIVVCEPDIERIWTMGRLFKFLEQNKIPHAVFANKIDESTVRVAQLIEALGSVSDTPLVPCQVAIREGDSVGGYVDLITGNAYQYADNQASGQIGAPDSVSSRQEEARTQLLESLADFDDSLLENLLEDKIPSEEEVSNFLRATLAEANVAPVFMGAAEKDWGVRRLLQAIISIGPDHVSSARLKEIDMDTAAPLGQIIKTYISPHGGKISLARIWRGEFADGTVLESGERIAGMFSLVGQQQTKISKAGAGQIVGLGRLNEIKTGATISPQDSPAADALPFAPHLPPVYSFAVHASKREDEVKLSAAIAKLRQEDPSVLFQLVPDTNDSVLWGQGEMHLRVALDRLKVKYGVALATEIPKVAYKEAIRKPVSQHSRFKKQSGGHGQFGDVHIDIKPLPRGTGFEFENTVVGGSVPKQYIPAVQNGVQEYLHKGPLGFPVVDVSVTLTDGKHHAVDSSEQAFKTAGRMAMSEGMPKCSPVLLEPIYEVKISAPSDFTPNVQRLITGRRGQVLGFSAKEDWTGWDETTFQMPQAEMHDLIIELRSLSLGVGSFEFEFDHLQELTGRLADDVLAAVKSAEE
ncbi:MAG: Elongation factor G [Alphaproteobacteria bacterium MarineAlpha10_Bin2]|nr:MAG: Elongation factor G [Alphaproteobacteria bacterium MarineAlpha10_Bin2]